MSDSRGEGPPRPGHSGRLWSAAGAGCVSVPTLLLSLLVLSNREPKVWVGWMVSVAALAVLIVVALSKPPTSGVVQAGAASWGEPSLARLLGAFFVAVVLGLAGLAGLALLVLLALSGRGLYGGGSSSQEWAEAVASSQREREEAAERAKADAAAAPAAAAPDAAAPDAGPSR